MAFSGMDVDAVETAAKRLKQSASSLQSLSSDIGREVGRLPGIWDGDDARQFVNEWWPKHRATLDGIVKAIEGLGQSAWNNAHEQRDASGNNTGTSPAPSATPATDSGSATPAAPTSSGGTGTVQQTTPGELAPWDEAKYRQFEGNTHWVGSGNDAYLADANGKAVDNCTAWAAWRRQELGLSAPRGNGGEMAGNVGGTRDTPPTLGAIVSDTQSAPPYGHVMIVEQTYSDGSFRVSQTNYNHSSAIYSDERWYPQADGTWKNQNGTVRDFVIAP